MIHFVAISKPNQAGFAWEPALVIIVGDVGRHETCNVSPLLFGSAPLSFHPCSGPGSAHSGRLFTSSLDELSGPSHLQTLLSALRSRGSERPTRKRPRRLCLGVFRSVSALVTVMAVYTAFADHPSGSCRESESFSFHLHPLTSATPEATGGDSGCRAEAWCFPAGEAPRHAFSSDDRVRDGRAARARLTAESSEYRGLRQAAYLAGPAEQGRWRGDGSHTGLPSVRSASHDPCFVVQALC